MKKVGYLIKVISAKSIDTDAYDYFSIEVDNDKTEDRIKKMIAAKHAHENRYDTQDVDSIKITTVEQVDLVKIK